MQIRELLSGHKENSDIDVPLFILFRALGILSDKEILEHILYDLNDPINKVYLDMLKSNIDDGNSLYTQTSAFNYLALKIHSFSHSF